MVIEGVILLFLATHLPLFPCIVFWVLFFLRAYIWLNLICSSIKALNWELSSREDVNFFLCPKTLGQNWLGNMLVIFIVTGPSLMHKPHIQLSHHVRDPEFSLWCQRLKSKVAPRATLTGVSVTYEIELILLFFSHLSSLPFFFLSVFLPQLLNTFSTFFDGQKCFIKFTFSFYLGSCYIVARGSLRIWARSRKFDQSFQKMPQFFLSSQS